MKIFTVLAIFASVLVSVHCIEISAGPRALFFEDSDGNQTDIEGSIYNGNRAVLGQFPYQAAISLVNVRGSVYVCGGTLIKYNWVLSTAFCMEHEWPRLFVTLGTLDMISGPYIWRSPNVPEYHRNLHPQFNRSNFENNIGLIFLWSATESLLAHEAIGVMPLPLATDVDFNFVGSSGLFAGFGRTHTGGISILYYITIPFIDQSVCQETFGSNTHSGNLCGSTSSGRSPCGGDTGSGIVVEANGRTFVAGLYSFNPQVCNVGHPAVFEDVASHLDWMDDVFSGATSMAKLSFGFLLALAAFVTVKM